MKVWKVKLFSEDSSGVSVWFETYEALEYFLDAMLYTSKGEEFEYWNNIEWETVDINEEGNSNEEPEKD